MHTPTVVVVVSLQHGTGIITVWSTKEKKTITLNSWKTSAGACLNCVQLSISFVLFIIFSHFIFQKRINLVRRSAHGDDQWFVCHSILCWGGAVAIVLWSYREKHHPSFWTGCVFEVKEAVRQPAERKGTDNWRRRVEKKWKKKNSRRNTVAEWRFLAIAIDCTKRKKKAKTNNGAIHRLDSGSVRVFGHK